MNLNKTIIVNQGQNMIAEAVNSSLPLIMTQFKLGIGTVNNETEALTLTDIVTFFRNQPIDSHTQNGNIYSATCKYNNEGILSDVTVTENGLYAKVGEGGIEKLFAYVTFEPGDFLPVAGMSVIAEYEKTLNFGITAMADVQIINSRFAEVAGKGLMENQTTGKIDVASANVGILINEDSIELKPTTKTTIGGTIVGNGLTVGLDGKIDIVSSNDGIIVNADNIELKPATTSIIGGVKPDGTTLTVDINGLIKTVDNKFFTNDGIPIPAGTNLNTFLTKGHYTSNGNANTSTMINTPFGETTSFTLVVDGIGAVYYTQLATRFYDGVQSCRVTYDNGANWTDWIEIINETKGDATYVKKAGDIMTGSLTAIDLAATNGTDAAAIYARYNNLATDQVYLYNNSTDIGIYNSMPTHGDVAIFLRRKSTGVVSYAGGNYGTINGSTATFSGNVTAPSITIGGYVVTIV